MKIAVTSASGQLGSAILTQLLQTQDKQDLVAIARNPQKAQHHGIETRAGDYINKEQFLKALQGVDTVLLVSGMDAPENRIQQHRNVIQAAVESGVKKIVYTSVIGPSAGTAFSPVVKSNRQTEQDVRASGLEWSIGRNGLYIEPDIEYIDHYKKAGKIANCAADGKCSYTTRSELAYAYSQMITDDQRNNHTFNLGGEPITQQQLTEFLNKTFNTNLIYESMSVADYKSERQAELGEFLGTVIAGIYEGIRTGQMQFESDFTKAAGRVHITWKDYFNSLK